MLLLGWEGQYCIFWSNFVPAAPRTAITGKSLTSRSGQAYNSGVVYARRNDRSVACGGLRVTGFVIMNTSIGAEASTPPRPARTSWNF